MRHQERPVREGRFPVAAQMKYEDKSFPDKENSRCKGPEAGTRLVCLRKSKKASVASASRGRRKGVKGEQAGGHKLTRSFSAKRGRGIKGFLTVADEGWSPCSLLPHTPCGAF